VYFRPQSGPTIKMMGQYHSPRARRDGETLRNRSTHNRADGRTSTYAGGLKKHHINQPTNQPPIASPQYIHTTHTLIHAKSTHNSGCFLSQWERRWPMVLRVGRLEKTIDSVPTATTAGAPPTLGSLRERTARGGPSRRRAPSIGCHEV